MFLSTLFCRKSATCQQGTKSARGEKTVPRVTPIIAWPSSKQATRVGWNVVWILEERERRMRSGRGRWRVVGERGDRARHSAARTGNTIKLSADPLSLTSNTSLSFSISVSLETLPYTCYRHWLYLECVSKGHQCCDLFQTCFWTETCRDCSNINICICMHTCNVFCAAGSHKY